LGTNAASQSEHVHRKKGSDKRDSYDRRRDRRDWWVSAVVQIVLHLP